MTKSRTRAFWIEAPGRGAIHEEELPQPGAGEVLVETHYGAVSRGTESLVFNGRVPESQYRAMRAPFQEGDFPAPLKYGYIAVGRVVEGPASLRDRMVFCLYPHQSAFVVPVGAVQALPPDLPPERAVLAANMGTAINGLWDATPRLGDRIAVIGAGVVGLLMAHLARNLPGCRVELFDIDPAKSAVAEALDLTLQHPEQAQTGAFDLVIHASGSPAGLATALSLAAFEARIVEMSWFGDRAVPLPLGEDFHVKRLQIVSSQVSTVATAQRARWPRERRSELALSLLKDASLDRLITGESPFEELPVLLQRLSSDPQGTLCHRIRHAAAGRAEGGPS